VIDLAVNLAEVDERELRHLAYFGTVGVAGLFVERTQPHTRRPLLGQLSKALELGSKRLHGAGLRGGIFLGISGEEAERPGVARALAELPALLDRPQCLGVGPLRLTSLRPRELRLAADQLELCKKLRRPALIRLGKGAHPESLAHWVSLFRAAELAPDTACVLHGSAREVVVLQSLGFLTCLDALSVTEATHHLSMRGGASLLLGSRLGFDRQDPVHTRLLLQRSLEAGVPSGVRRSLAHRRALGWLGKFPRY